MGGGVCILGVYIQGVGGLHPRWGEVCIGGSCIRGWGGGWADPLGTAYMGVCMGHYGKQSTSGRYAFYWNAFLFICATVYRNWKCVCFSQSAVKYVLANHESD